MHANNMAIQTDFFLDEQRFDLTGLDPRKVVY